MRCNTFFSPTARTGRPQSTSRVHDHNYQYDVRGFFERLYQFASDHPSSVLLKTCTLNYIIKPDIPDTGSVRKLILQSNRLLLFYLVLIASSGIGDINQFSK